ncbi:MULTISPECIES: sugar-binding transcriptional regulator [unclassified Enterococcus]|uniref:sugar-binding transcriptional regulator n=1 Tax=unclassified Enterococcus TaxID=2608891 RepID=UPI001A910687|nr:MULTISPECIES: sugar-binding transcriptional regulator [unclassified Enterococcus]MBO0460230.1 sugar-binding transcriptional regulator [Enterococcus sp. DIV1298c]MBO1299637.1 sugar-binding transcriptional regulator [Enterococcus sp. DIV1271a]
MGYSDDKRLLVELASMYYNEGAKQEEIAKKFSISRSLVSKYLAKARSLGLVEIIIHDDLIHPFQRLEQKVQKKYQLKEVICVHSIGEESLNKRLGIATARYLSRIIKADTTIAISAGTTLHEAAVIFSVKNHLPNVRFIPMVGGLGREHVSLQSNVICELLANKCGGIALELHAPITVDSAEAKQVFLSQSFIKNVLEEAKHADISLVGIGGTPVYSTMTKAYLAKEDGMKVDFTNGEIIGDICYNFIDEEGSVVDCEWNKRVLSLEIADLKKIPLKIAAAGGKDKIKGIKAALTNRLIDVLIIDEDTAKFLLNEYI